MLPVCGVRPARGRSRGGMFGSRAGEHPAFRVEVVGLRRLRTWGERGDAAETEKGESVARSMERQQRREAARDALRAAIRGSDDRARRVSALQEDVLRLLDVSRTPWIRYEGDWVALRRTLAAVARESATSADPAGLGAVRGCLQAAGLSVVEADEFARSVVGPATAGADAQGPDDGAVGALRFEEQWTSRLGAQVVLDEETVRQRRAEAAARREADLERQRTARETRERLERISRLRWRQLAMEAAAGVGAGLPDDPRRSSLRWSRSNEAVRTPAPSAAHAVHAYAYERAWARPDAVPPSGDAAEASAGLGAISADSESAGSESDAVGGAVAPAARPPRLLCTQDPSSSWLGVPRPFHPSPVVPDHLALHVLASSDPALATALCRDLRASLKERAERILGAAQ
jgi:hypothetical protein